MITASARVRPAPAQRPMRLPIMSLRPVRCMPALSTKMAATTMAGSLENPARASFGSSRPVTARARTMRTPTTSLRSRSVISRAKATTRIAKNVISGRVRSLTHRVRARGVPAGRRTTALAERDGGGALGPEDDAALRLAEEDAEGAARRGARAQLDQDRLGELPAAEGHRVGDRHVVVERVARTVHGGVVHAHAAGAAAEALDGERGRARSHRARRGSAERHDRELHDAGGV